MNMPGMLINNPVCYIRAKIPGQFDPLFFDIENVKNRFLISKVEIIQPPPHYRSILHVPVSSTYTTNKYNSKFLFNRWLRF